MAGEFVAGAAGALGEANEPGVVRSHTALHQAAEDGWVEGVALFLEIDRDAAVAMAAFDYIWRTPLITAAQNGHLDVCRVLSRREPM